MLTLRDFWLDFDFQDLW